MAPKNKNQQQQQQAATNANNNPLFAPPYLGYTATNNATNSNMSNMQQSGINYSAAAAQWDLYNNLNANTAFNVNAPSVPATAADLNVNLAAAAELCYGSTNANTNGNHNVQQQAANDASNNAFDPFNLIGTANMSAQQMNMTFGNVNPFSFPGNANTAAQQAGLNPLLHASMPSLGGPMAMPNSTSSTTTNSHSAATTTATMSTASSSNNNPKPTKPTKKQRPSVNFDEDCIEAEETLSHLPSTLPPNASAEDKAAFHRERNRQHARSTRARKKAYVNKLKELVEHLHMERTEEARKRRIAAGTLAELTRMRKGVVLKFLELHSNATTDPSQFMTVMEPACWFRQPITPYRWFNRAEITAENRVSNGIPAIIADCASMGVMITNIGCRSSRWSSLRRCEFLGPSSHQHQHQQHLQPHPQHAISSLSSNTLSCDNDIDDSSGSGSTPESNSNSNSTLTLTSASNNGNGNGNTCSSNSNNNENENKKRASKNSNLLHDYHAQPLPDPLLLDDNDCSDDSNSNSNGSSRNKNTSSRVNANVNVHGKSSQSRTSGSGVTSLDNTTASESTIATTSTSTKNNVTNPAAMSNIGGLRKTAPVIPLPPFVGLGKRAAVPMPVVIAPAPLKGAANSTTNNNNDRAKKRSKVAVDSRNSNNNNNNSSKEPKMTSTVAAYSLNQDDMMLTGNTLMCPFTFRTRNGIHQGALAEVIQPGMLRVTFSPANNRLSSIEMVFDAMGFMQQLERANGSPAAVQTNTNVTNQNTNDDANAAENDNDNSNENDNSSDSNSNNTETATSLQNQPQSESLVVPNGLEMALQPNPEARVITLADPPYSIVSVNEGFVRLAKYTQLDAEGKTVDDLLRSVTVSRSTGAAHSNYNSAAQTVINNGNVTNNCTIMPPPESTSISTPTNTCNNTAAAKHDANAQQQTHTLSSALLSRGDSTHPCSTTLLHTDKKGKSFANFISSYPLTNAANQVTHLLHVCRELRGMHSIMDSHNVVNAYSSHNHAQYCGSV